MLRGAWCVCVCVYVHVYVWCMSEQSDDCRTETDVQIIQIKAVDKHPQISM